METQNGWLRDELESFAQFIEQCLAHTKFDIDKPSYRRDLEMVNNWINALNDGQDPMAVARQIIDPQVDKIFGDYFKQGTWGEREISNLKKLQHLIISKMHFN